MASNPMLIDHPGVVARPPRIAGLLLAVGGLLEWLWRWPLLPMHGRGLLRWGWGGALVVLGLAVMAVAVRAFRAAGTNVETPKPAISLVTEGIYGLSRNPMYVSLTLLFGGIAVLANSGWLTLLVLPFLAVLRVGVIPREERYLERKFGEPYRAYRARVRRWL